MGDEFKIHSTSGLIERRLTLDDIAGSVLLSKEAGWNQTARDWQLMIKHGQGFGFETAAGRLVATALTLPHGKRVAWISLVLVTRDFQKRGLATRLLGTCIESLTRQSIFPLLDATDAGRVVYDKLGFRELYRLHRLIRQKAKKKAVESKLNPELTIHPITKSDLPLIISYDKKVFGADRAVVLNHLQDRRPADALFVFDQRSEVLGFVMAREGRHALHIGPIVAGEAEAAMTLTNAVLDRVEGPVYVDALDCHQDFLSWLEDQGFEIQRSFTRMVLGSMDDFDRPEYVYAAAGPEFG